MTQQRGRKREAGAAPTKEWTILVFMVPDDRLAVPAQNDIAEMTEVDSLDDLNVVVHLDDHRRPQRFLIQPGKAEPLEAPRPYAMAKSLEAFIAWGLATYPAKRHALILWGHGQGVGTRLSRPAPLAEANGELSGTGFRAGLRGLGLPSAASFQTLSTYAGPYLGSPPLITTGQQATGPEVMNVKDVAKAIHRAAGEQTLDILGFDACFMSGIETAFQLRTAARLLVASQDFVPDEGWDYRSFLNIVTTHSLECGAVANSILEHVADRGGLTNLSVVDLSHAEELSTRLATLVYALQASVNRNTSEVLRVQMLCESTASLRIRQMIDLFDLCNRISSDFGDTAEDDELDCRVRDAAKAMMAALVAAVKYQAEGIAEKLNGLSIVYDHVDAGFSLPGDPGPPELYVEVNRTDYDALDLTKSTGWLRLLDALEPVS